MKSIILIGYMCAGKTTVGKSLAKNMGISFYDLDWYIEDRFHKRIPEIFAEKGEEGFRDIERRMLHEAAEFEDIVLSCGGGTPCFFDNMKYMNQTGTTFYLKASPETIIAHHVALLLFFIAQLSPALRTLPPSIGNPGRRLKIAKPVFR